MAAAVVEIYTIGFYIKTEKLYVTKPQIHIKLYIILRRSVLRQKDLRVNHRRNYLFNEKNQTSIQRASMNFKRCRAEGEDAEKPFN